MDYDAKRYIKGRGITLTFFEAVYKAIGASIVIPFCLWLINASIKSIGIDYIAPQNIGNLFNPVVITAIVAVAVIMSLYTLIELAAILTCLEYAHYNKYIGVRRLIFDGLRRSVRALRPCNWGIIPFAVIIVPAGNLFLSSGVIGELKLPEYIAEVVKANSLYSIGLTVITVAVSFLALRWLYVFNIFFLEGKTMRQSAKDSAQMMHGRYISTAFSFIWWMIKVAVKVALVCGILILIGLALLYAFSSSDGIYAALMGVIDIAQTIASFVISIVMLVSSYAFISSRYYAIRSELGEIDEDKQLIESRTHTRFITVIAVLISAVFMLASAVSAYWVINSGRVFDDEDIKKIRVVAHRGCSYEAPENTLPAYLKAIEAKADYGELDVHWTRDKHVVLSHDNNLKNTGGVNINIWDISYSELMQIDRGSMFNEDYAGTRYASLEEIMIACKDKLDLIIEIKMDGHDIGIEKDVVELIHKYGYENDCYVGSLSYECLERVKQCDETIKTMYFAPFAIGSVETLDSADAVGIEMTFLSEDIVDSLHSASKPVFVWTVDDEEHIKKCVELEVDYIISNYPENTRSIIEENGNELFRTLIELREHLGKYSLWD